MRSAVVASMCSALLLPACASSVTLNRYAEVEEPLPAAVKPELRVSSAPAESGEPLSLKALPGETGGAYVDGVAKWVDNPKALREALAEPIVKDAGSSVDRTRVSRVVIVSVQRSTISPGDRLLMTRIEITPAEGSFTFTGYQAAATEYTTIKIGDVSITDETTSEAAIEPTFGADLVGAGTFGLSRTAGSSASRGISERQQLSVTPSPNSIEIIRTGGEGTDLTGNTLVKLSVQTDKAKAVPYLIASAKILDKGVPLSADKAELSWSRVLLPEPKDLYVCARLSYQERLVTDGAKYLDEGRQTVRFETVSGETTPFLLVPATDIAPALWIIQTPNAALMVDTGLGFETLHFRDFDSAYQFMQWLLLKRSASIGGRVLAAGVIDSDPVPLASFEGLKVSRVGSGPVSAPPACGR